MDETKIKKENSRAVSRQCKKNERKVDWMVSNDKNNQESVGGKNY